MKRPVRRPPKSERSTPRDTEVTNPLYGRFNEMVRAVLRPVKPPSKPKPVKGPPKMGRKQRQPRRSTAGKAASPDKVRKG